ncbi:HAMP domain-containing histidine kinase [bacterium]|nr:HAMP domain-containing histidine kinase [candidate division CSSED10-310 bacterium]
MEKLRVLVVDDEQPMRMAVAIVLGQFIMKVKDLDEEYGFEVEEVGTAEEGFERIKQRPPDLLLLDYKLPGMSGLDLLKKLSDEQDMVIIMFSAYASLKTAITATKRGSFDFLAKPFTPDELTTAVRYAARHLLLRRHARKLAQEKHQIRFQFISVLTHELKSPLAAVEGYLYMLKDGSAGADPETQQHLVERCLVRVEGMRKLIFDILDLTRLESGKKQREIEPVDLTAQARQAIETAGPTAAERGITFNLAAPDSLVMSADRGEIDIVFNNLVSNAVKYNKENGVVFVELRQDDHDMVVSVRDTGIGMTDTEVGKLFREFVRIKNAKTRNILGSGLGLSIVKKIAQLYEGDVSVTSEPDVGSTFTVRLNTTAGLAPETAEQE